MVLLLFSFVFVVVDSIIFVVLLFFLGGSSDTQSETPIQTTRETSTKVETPQPSTYSSTDYPDQKISSQPTEPTSAHSNSGGAVYIRWGRTVCPDSASIVYKGTQHIIN